jgi:alpha-galactosidase
MAQRCAIETTTTSVNRWRNPTPPGLLSNDEVLALDQDALGRQAVRAAAIGQVDVFAKELEDGSTALGFFNRGDDVAKINFNKLGYIGLSGGFHVRDLWR